MELGQDSTDVALRDVHESSDPRLGQWVEVRVEHNSPLPRRERFEDASEVRLLLGQFEIGQWTVAILGLAPP